MPIRPELRKFYSGPAWKATRTRILERAKNCCEQCGKRHHRKVWVFNPRHAIPDQYWSAVKGDGQKWRSCNLAGIVMKTAFLAGKEWRLARQVRVVITIAHLNHVAGDDRDENLKALCQWCHLHYDRLHHRETRIARKDATRPILHAPMDVIESDESYEASEILQRYSLQEAR